MSSNPSKKGSVSEKNLRKKGVRRGVRTGGSSKGGTNPPKLSENQADILYLLTKEFNTPKQIASRRQKTVRAVQKTIKKLRDKGFLKGWYRGVRTGGSYKGGVVPQKKQKRLHKKEPHQDDIRLHFMQVHCRIINASPKYIKQLEKSNLLYYDDNKVFLHDESVEIFLTEDFYGEDESRCLAMASQELNRIEVRLENDLGIVLVKPRIANHKVVNWHFGHTGNRLAKDLNEKKRRLAVYSRDDGRMWLYIDNSKPDGIGLHECETLHPDTADRDMSFVREFFNNLRDKYAYREFFRDLGSNPMTLSNLRFHLYSYIDKKFDEMERRLGNELSKMYEYMWTKEQNDRGNRLN